MQTVPVKLLVVIAEAVLEDRLISLLRQAGARGYTVSDVRGEGSRGLRVNELDGKSVRIETLVSPEVAERVLERLAAEYFPRFAVVAYQQDVEVVRGGKYQ
mgnify:CR=1 FL=1